MINEARKETLASNLAAWFENRNSNITTHLSCTCGELAESIIKAFSDLRLVAQIREEIEKVKPSLALAA